MEKLFTDEQTEQIKAEFWQYRKDGLSKNKSLETIAKKWHCSVTAAAKYTNAWDTY